MKPKLSQILQILYRGPLSSCNYRCWYCPFEKRPESALETAKREADRLALERFVTWVERWRGDRIAVFFTPRGEALIWERYQRALARLSNMPHVEKVVIQTNLSCRLDWIEACDRRRLALWATYHPSETARSRFVAQCSQLERCGVRFSAGAVGMREHLEEIEALRRELPHHIYLWVNAYKHGADYYTEEHLRRLEAVDPLFPINNHRYPSQGRLCRCGHSVISVDGEGTVQRCHFIETPIGNIYEPGFEATMRKRYEQGESECTSATCGCHIGYVHLVDLGLYGVFGAGVLERIPARFLHGEAEFWAHIAKRGHET